MEQPWDQGTQASQEETLINWMANKNPLNKIDLAINAYEALLMKEKETVAARMELGGLMQDFHNA